MINTRLFGFLFCCISSFSENCLKSLTSRSHLVAFFQIFGVAVFTKKSFKLFQIVEEELKITIRRARFCSVFRLIFRRV